MIRVKDETKFDGDRRQNIVKVIKRTDECNVLKIEGAILLKCVKGTFAQISAKLDNLTLPLTRNKVVLLLTKGRLPLHVRPHA